MHWGQILVKGADTPAQPRLSKSKKVPMDHDAYGVKATVIDLGLSRMNANDGNSSSVHYTPFDDEVFEGEGNYFLLTINPRCLHDIFRRLPVRCIPDDAKTRR